MKYYITKKIDATFEQAIDEVKEALAIQGFGVLSEINMHDKFKEKLDVDFRRYTILGHATRPTPTKRYRAKTKSAPCFRVMWLFRNLKRM